MDHEADMFEAPLASLREQLRQSGFELPIANFTEYIASIDWTETWLRCLCCWHILMLILVILSRNYFHVQCAIGLIMLGLAYSSERLNQLASENWRYFSKEPYFDKDGLFIFTVFGVPILFNCMVILINLLYQNCRLIKDVQTLKAKQLKKTLKGKGSTASTKKDD